jgi:hypothetical protein
MSPPKSIDPVLEELVREIARQPQSRLLRETTRDATGATNLAMIHESAASDRPTSAESELLRVYRTQAAQLWCDAALESLLESKTGREVYFQTRAATHAPVTMARIHREQSLFKNQVAEIGPIELLLGLWGQREGGQEQHPQNRSAAAMQFARISHRLFPSARACLVLADAHWDAGDRSGARTACVAGLRVAARTSEKAQLHERMGIYARQDGDGDRAIHHALAASRQDARNVGVLWNGLRTSLELGNELVALAFGGQLNAACHLDANTAQRLADGLSQRRKARNAPAAITFHPHFARIRAQLDSTSKGLIDAFA